MTTDRAEAAKPKYGTCLLKTALFIPLFLLLMVCAAIAWMYYHPDEIERAERDTRRCLVAFERSGDAMPVRKWIVTYHGEAPDTQVMITVGKWSIRHPSEFLTIVEGLPSADRQHFCEFFAFVLADSGLDRAFRHAFSGQASPVVRHILDNIPASEPWPAPQNAGPR